MIFHPEILTERQRKGCSSWDENREGGFYLGGGISLPCNRHAVRGF